MQAQQTARQSAMSEADHRSDSNLGSQIGYEHVRLACGQLFEEINL